MGTPNHVIVESVNELESALSRADRPAGQLVHYFASDCHGCKAMHPKLLQLEQTYSGVSFVMVRFWCSQYFACTCLTRMRHRTFNQRHVTTYVHFAGEVRCKRRDDAVLP
jgi:hypothetical protein